MDACHVVFVALNRRDYNVVRDVRGRSILAITDYAANWHETGDGGIRDAA